MDRDLGVLVDILLAGKVTAAQSLQECAPKGLRHVARGQSAEGAATPGE